MIDGRRVIVLCNMVGRRQECIHYKSDDERPCKYSGCLATASVGARKDIALCLKYGKWKSVALDVLEELP